MSFSASGGDVQWFVRQKPVTGFKETCQYFSLAISAREQLRIMSIILSINLCENFVSACTFRIIIMKATKNAKSGCS